MTCENENEPIAECSFSELLLHAREVQAYEEGSLAAGQLGERMCAATGQKDPLVALYLILGARDNLYGFEEERVLDYVTETFESMKPRDLVEASLIQQFIVLHHHGIHRMREAKESEYVECSHKHINMATKLLRLSQETLATLLRYRNKGQQQVFVTHVDDGGKAIIGNIGVGGS